MNNINAQDFKTEVNCTYDDEQYSVRDNGSVLRYPRTGKRPRPTDNQWTFGKPNSQNGYMYISQARIHRIVATAFHGQPPTPEHVVDHIDTNRKNNRPENLRWLTRLENVLLNPITVKRIEFLCGSIEAFLEDPSKIRHSSFERDIGWMRTVTPQEAQACLERMNLWTKSDKPPCGRGSLGEWVYKPVPQNRPLKASVEILHTTHTVSPSREWASPSNMHDLVMAATPGAAQRKWRIPSEFPCCPQKPEKEPIVAYAANLKASAIFSCNNLSTHRVLETAVVDDGQALCVMCESDGLKPWSLAKITYEDGLYVHTSIRTYFSKEGAEKQFCLERGLEWTGGDSIDDYC